MKNSFRNEVRMNSNQELGFTRDGISIQLQPISNIRYLASDDIRYFQLPSIKPSLVFTSLNWLVTCHDNHFLSCKFEPLSENELR